MANSGSCYIVPINKSVDDHDLNTIALYQGSAVYSKILHVIDKCQRQKGRGTAV